jgi:outer membrane protein assembly factor BamB
MSCLTLALILVALAAGSAAAGENWPNFRGPNHTGVVAEADPPMVWSEDRNVLWKTELEGVGHASPVVWGDHIYVLSTAKTKRTGQPKDRPAAEEPRSRPDQPPRHRPTHVYEFIVSAYDLASGERIWRTVVLEEVPHEALHSTASQASASPVTDGKHIWAFFGSRGLFCLDRDGKLVWSVDFGTQNTRNEFGEGSSPVVHGDLVVINWDHEGDSFIVAVDKKTGKERWRTARDEPTSWSTPLVVRDGDRDLVVVSAANRVRAYALETGKEVWSAAGLGLNVVPTPLTDGEMLWAMSGWREAHGMAIRYPGAEGDLTGSDRIVWEADRGLSYVPSAVLHDGRLYFFQRFSGILSCHELKTGKACYERQRIESFENVYASPVGAADRIYAVSRDGAAVVFRAGDRFELLATNHLDDVFNATPAIVGNSLILRGDRYVYRIAAE